MCWGTRILDQWYDIDTRGYISATSNHDDTAWARGYLLSNTIFANLVAYSSGLVVASMPTSKFEKIVHPIATLAPSGLCQISGIVRTNTNELRKISMAVI
jgi:hypothetical protein